VRKILLVRLECKGISVEKLGYMLSKIAEPRFLVWLYDKKAYAAFKVNSLSVLKNLIQRLKRVKGLEFNVYRLEELYE
jgi:hypothetical protein